ncbi:MAG: hypothetical protein HOF44_03045, partial [Pelagibacterales bacterium]|nr:hypothetical protein [Pelagibacterales bacterium]
MKYIVSFIIQFSLCLTLSTSILYSEDTLEINNDMLVLPISWTDLLPEDAF